MLKQVSLQGLMLSFLILVSGCSTTYSHFGRFYAENSAGEAREFLLEWDSTSGAFSSKSEGTDVQLTSQCSDRVIVFTRSTEGHEVACSDPGGSEAVFCGRAGADLSMDGKEIREAGRLCGYIRGTGGELAVGQFGKTVAVTLQCFPLATTQGEGDDQHNIDYLKASTVPYIVTVQKVIQGSSEDRPPVLTSRVCGG